MAWRQLASTVFEFLLAIILFQLMLVCEKSLFSQNLTFGDLWWLLSTWPENDPCKSLKARCHLSRRLPLVAKWRGYQDPKGVSEASYHHHHNLSFLKLSKNMVYAEILLVSEYCTRWTNMWNIKCLSWSHLPCTFFWTNIDNQYAFK